MTPPAVLHLLGHGLRWQLVSELCRSDLKVGELTEATGQPQNLVSYHLRLLREAGLVRERRSSADARDVYYTPNRRAISEGFMGAVGAIDPRAQQLDSGRAPKHSSPAGPRTSVLFVCTGNSARSLIAEAMLRQRAGRHVMVRSGGTIPVGIHPQVYRVLKARRVRSGDLRSKSVAEFARRRFDYVISLCDIARSEQIGVGGRPRLVHWSVPDPGTAPGGPPEVSRAFDQVADEIDVRVTEFHAGLRARRSAA